MTNAKSVLTAACFLSFFAFGFIDNMKGPVLPLLLSSENLSLSDGGTIFLGAYFGFVVATMFTGLLADVVGNRRVLLMAGVCLCIGLGGIGFVKGYWPMVLFMSVVGLGLGAIELGANGFIVELHSNNAGRFLNLLATFHGTGSFLVPIYVGWLIQSGHRWQSIFTSAVLIAGPLTLLLFLAPKHVLNDRPSGKTKTDLREVLRTASRGRMLLIYVLICSYVATELGIGAWLMKYLQQVRNLSVTESSYYMSGFFVAIMLGRLLGSMIVDRAGYLLSIGLALVGGIICLCIGLLGPDSTLVAISLSGASFSIVFPTLTAFVTRMHREHVGAILGVLFTFGGLGGALGPWAIGWMSQWYGLQLGMCTTFGFGLIALLAQVVIMRSTPTCIDCYVDGCEDNTSKFLIPTL